MINLLLILAIAMFCCYKIYSDRKWHQKPIQNFPFYHKGKVFWYSRSVATTIGVFCLNAENKWCVLANKRGRGVPDYKGYWNIVCGYLEHGITGEENCQKEVYEECGVFIPCDKIRFYSVSTSPSQNKQNVIIKYITQLEGTCDEYDITNEYCDEDEVDDVKWIPVEEIGEYKWAFNHKEVIQEMFKKII